MVLILLSWVYLFFTSMALGIGFSKLFRIPTPNTIYYTLLGLLSVTMAACVWAIVGPVNFIFHGVLITTSFTLLWVYKTDCLYILNDLKNQFTSFHKTIKWLLIVSSVLCLAQSATSPSLIDNQTYYVQTIKWLNEYGLVPGLANLHLFLGQTSGWHITQSVYSFSFFTNGLNDINGYLFLVGNYWAFQKLHSYFLHQKRIDLVFGLLPLVYPFLFLFINSPSPDFPVYMMGFMVFSLYLEADSNHFKTMTALCLFAVYIKITAFVLLLFPLFLILKDFRSLQKSLLSMGLLGGVVGVVLVTKNIILTGYPLYPLPWFPCQVSHLVPQKVLTYFFSPDVMHSFYIPYGTFEKATITELLKHYFLYSGIDSGIAWITLVLIVIAPFIIATYYPKQKLLNIYIVFVIWLVLLAVSSPQFRFYVYFPIFFGLVCAALLFTKRQTIVILFGLSLMLTTILVFVPIAQRKIGIAKTVSKTDRFEVKNIIFPKANRHNDLGFATEVEGNLHYYSPISYDFFWMTGNTDLPCVTKEQLDYFKTNFHIIPQMRGTTLGEGFYAQKTNHD